MISCKVDRPVDLESSLSHHTSLNLSIADSGRLGACSITSRMSVEEVMIESSTDAYADRSCMFVEIISSLLLMKSPKNQS